MPAVLDPLWVNLGLGLLVWAVSVPMRNVAIVDLLWPVLFVSAAWIWADLSSAGLHAWIVVALVSIWGVRLHAHLALRNIGKPEDRRYQAIRANNSPGFWWKSLYIVFVFQGVIAWAVAMPLYAVLRAPSIPVWAVVAGGLLAMYGLVFETLADWQLTRFKRTASPGAVMDRGVWGLSRHPNYFGECCFWWGIFLLGLPHSAWTIFAPVLMTFLLLRVSGVSLLEKDIAERRPAYREYIERVPAFVPSFFRQARREKGRSA